MLQRSMLPRIIILGLVLLSLPGTLVQASIIEPIQPISFVERAKLIVRGVVVSQKIHEVGPTKKVVTDSVVKVKAFLKGRTVAPFVTVRTMGGTIGQFVFKVSGEAKLRQGEHVVLFLREIEGIYYLTAMGRPNLFWPNQV